MKAGAAPEEATRLASAVVDDWRTAPLAPLERALCAFAAKLTLRQREMSPSDLDALRAHGLDDRALHEAAQVVGYFNYITRVADALGVELEADAPRYGRGPVSRGPRPSAPATRRRRSRRPRPRARR